MNDITQDDYKSAIKLPVNINRVAVAIYIFVVTIILYLNINVDIPVYKTYAQYIEIKPITIGEFKLFNLKQDGNFLPGKQVTILLHPTKRIAPVQFLGDIYAFKNDTAWIKMHSEKNDISNLYGFADITTVQKQTSILQRIMSSFTGGSK